MRQMKINESLRVGGVNPYRKTANEHHVSAARAGKKDGVEISAEAKELLSSVRNPERLEALKQAVSTGTYQVDAGKVAERLWPYIQ